MGSIGFIGGGQMAQAIIGGILKANLRDSKSLYVFDINKDAIEKVSKLGVNVEKSEVDVAKKSDVIFLAVKPNIVSEVLKKVRDEITESKLIVSIAAGITIDSMQSLLPKDSQVIRVMPNTPCLIGESAAAVSQGKSVTPKSTEIVMSIFSSVGLAVKVDEKYLDAVTGLSGSGPAYVFMFIEALADGGVRSGLPRDVAMDLAVQLVKGSAKMVQETKVHPGELKDRVASPGGTTIAGIHKLESGAFRASVIDAVYAATLRSQELSKM
jgi:pyrroline-5-carboxylate reductase